MNSVRRLAAVSLIANVLCAAGHIALGLTQPSAWFTTIGVYELALGVARLVVLLSDGRCALRTMDRFAGTMLMVFALPLLGVVILSAVRDRGTVFHEILMISIALYTFVKITIAVVNICKMRSQPSAILRPLRNLSLADALVSVGTLQRSMLVSFEGMESGEIRIFNIATGTAVCLAVFALGFLLVRRKKPCKPVNE